MVESAFDAYLEHVASKLACSSGREKEKNREEDLISYMKSAPLENTTSLMKKPVAPSLQIIRGGEEIPYVAPVELKICSKLGTGVGT